MLIIDQLLILFSLINLIFLILLMIYSWITRKKLGAVYHLILLFSILLLLAWAVFRSIITYHVPFSNAYESIIFFSFLYLIKIFLTHDNKNRALFLLPAAILLLIALLLPEPFKIPRSLEVVLNSFWIYIHVPAFFLGYVSLTFALLFAVIEFFNDRPALSAAFEQEFKLSFFFITLGIITGAFWADQSWAAFWSWDPKEVWALITWLFLVIVFHVQAKKIKILFVIFSFLAMLFTYFGVMFILEGLHSYK